MKKFVQDSLQNSQGQTSIEYILMIVVMVSIMTGMFKQLEGYMVSNPDSMFNNIIKVQSFDPSFKNFRLRR